MTTASLRLLSLIHCRVYRLRNLPFVHPKEAALMIDRHGTHSDGLMTVILVSSQQSVMTAASLPNLPHNSQMDWRFQGGEKPDLSHQQVACIDSERTQCQPMKFFGVVRLFGTAADKLECFRANIVQYDVAQKRDEMV